ncbi:aquaporin Z [Xanthomonas sontii]|uniref:Aquaporin Z n=1 Tax=Xanthomonas sontii TaxID=2650745 RepID=A0A6N7QH80_9XANT|nr:aquaporin Z [Xanthomonas sontii]MRH02527.1 aquaporin Z [Xanthomonas sontii]MRH76830.1 aquaporin Z [Xanthomonas sontii]
MFKNLLAEAAGTFWLVLGGCGAALLAGGSIGNLGVALAFGLSVLTGLYALGHLSGGHFNPAVSLGLWAGGRFPLRQVPGYVLAQLVGGIGAAALLYLVHHGSVAESFQAATPAAFASNGYGDLSPDGYGAVPAFLLETVLTAVFVGVIMGATRRGAAPAAAPVAIGLCLALIHLVSIPVTNTSVNPARSTAMALFASDGAMQQLWMFWVAPLLGGALGGVFARWLLRPRRHRG